MLINVFEKHSCEKVRVSEMYSSLRKLLAVWFFSGDCSSVMMSKVVEEGWKADDYYCVKSGQIVGVPWCHFVLGKMEAEDRIHISYFVSSRPRVNSVLLTNPNQALLAYVSMATTTDRKTTCSAVLHEELLSAYCVWAHDLITSLTLVSVAQLVAHRTHNRKVVGSGFPLTQCVSQLTGNRLGVNCPLWPATTPFSEL